MAKKDRLVTTTQLPSKRPNAMPLNVPTTITRTSPDTEWTGNARWKHEPTPYPPEDIAAAVAAAPRTGRDSIRQYAADIKGQAVERHEQTMSDQADRRAYWGEKDAEHAERMAPIYSVVDAFEADPEGWAAIHAQDPEPVQRQRAAPTPRKISFGAGIGGSFGGRRKRGGSALGKATKRRW